jgi:hypothetical protein
MKDFRDLKVWEKSHYLTLKIYNENLSNFRSLRAFILTNEIIIIQINQ